MRYVLRGVAFLALSELAVCALLDEWAWAVGVAVVATICWERANDLGECAPR